ncbi:MAG TPA: CoA transferase [Candidatus Binatia bacterium]|nr:CoA transferase [Candidatus Binatia bacterium]
MPFMPVAGHVGSDYERLRPDFKVIPNPFDPSRRVMVVPAIRCDVSLVHALAAAPDGTLLLDPMEDDALLAQASDVVVASAERVAAADEIRRAATGLVLEGIHVTAVVEVPRGAHPTLVRGAYDLDARHLEEYVEAACGDARFREYLERYVFGPKDHAAYLALVDSPRAGA